MRAWILAFLVGCIPGDVPDISPEPPAREVIVHIASGFTSSERREIERGIATWNKALNGQIHIRVVDDNPSIILIHKVDASVPDPPDAAGAVAWVDDLRGNDVSVRDSVPVNWMKPVILHEIGHIFGAEHLQGTTMNPKVDPSVQCVDYTTGRQVAPFLHVDPNTLWTCP